MRGSVGARKSHEIMGDYRAGKRGRMRKNASVGSSGYYPTEAEMEEDVSIGATPEEVASALFADDPPLEKSGKEDQSKKEFEA